MADVKIMHLTNPTATDSSGLQFKFGAGTGQASGLQSLMQLVVVHLLSEPGSDALHPDTGGGLVNSLGGLGSINNTGQVVAAVQASVSKTEQEIVADQAVYSLPASERLRSIRIVSVEPIVNSGTVKISLRIQNESGQEVEVGL